MAGHFRHRALFIGPNARAAVNEGRADYVPVFLSDVPRLFNSGALALDAVLVNATPPDAHGFCSLGVSVEAMHAAIRAARTVIVQLNRAMPRTLGESFIHVDDIDLAVEVDVPPYEHEVGPIGDVERRVGEHVADLVPDGATLQLGIGAIPAATALALRDKRDKFADDMRQDLATSFKIHTGDGLLNIAANQQQQFQALCRLIARPELAADFWPTFPSMPTNATAPRSQK
jgi:acyl-CoA hydrolase